jgi:hypothetical protein
MNSDSFFTTKIFLTEYAATNFPTTTWEKEPAVILSITLFTVLAVLLLMLIFRTIKDSILLNRENADFNAHSEEEEIENNKTDQV